MTEMTPGRAAAGEWHRRRLAAGKTLAGEYGCTLQCTEAEAAAYLYRTLGDEATADAVIAAHAAYDEPGEMHSNDPLHDDDAQALNARLAELRGSTHHPADDVTRAYNLGGGDD